MTTKDNTPVQPAAPVAWIDPADLETLEEDGWCVVYAAASAPGADHCADQPLYAAPLPQAAPQQDAESVARWLEDHDLLEEAAKVRALRQQGDRQ